MLNIGKHFYRFGDNNQWFYFIDLFAPFKFLLDNWSEHLKYFSIIKSTQKQQQKHHQRDGLSI